jgi:hypothetical protein
MENQSSSDCSLYRPSRVRRGIGGRTILYRARQDHVLRGWRRDGALTVRGGWHAAELHRRSGAERLSRASFLFTGFWVLWFCEWPSRCYIRADNSCGSRRNGQRAAVTSERSMCRERRRRAGLSREIVHQICARRYSDGIYRGRWI